MGNFRPLISGVLAPGLTQRMEDMQKTLERLDYKITSYENQVVEKEKELTDKSNDE